MEQEPNKFISIQEATKFCQHSQEYLSLRARQGKLKAVKFGRNWVTKKEWLDAYKPKENNTIWDIGFWGIKSMLRDLGEHTGLKCNPHTFRRTFAVLLRKEGIDGLTIQQLGRWESLEMVQRYTRSFTFRIQ